jgi:hypothetical protein
MKATAAAVKRIPGWYLGWGTFKRRLMERLGVPISRYHEWDVPPEWIDAYKRASGRPHAIRKTYAGQNAVRCGVCHRPVTWRACRLVHV